MERLLSEGQGEPLWPAMDAHLKNSPWYPYYALAEKPEDEEDFPAMRRWQERTARRLQEQQERGVWGSLERTFGGLEFALYNVATLRFGSAFRNIADVAGGIVTLDPFTGWWRDITDGTGVSKKEDRPYFSDFLDRLGVPTFEQGSGARIALDILAGFYTDPIMHVISLGIGKGAAAIGKMGMHGRRYVKPLVNALHRNGSKAGKIAFAAQADIDTVNLVRATRAQLVKQADSLEAQLATADRHLVGAITDKLDEARKHIADIDDAFGAPGKEIKDWATQVKNGGQGHEGPWSKKLTEIDARPERANNPVTRDLLDRIHEGAELHAAENLLRKSAGLDALTFGEKMNPALKVGDEVQWTHASRGPMFKYGPVTIEEIVGDMAVLSVKGDPLVAPSPAFFRRFPLKQLHPWGTTLEEFAKKIPRMEELTDDLLRKGVAKFLDDGILNPAGIYAKAVWPVTWTATGLSKIPGIHGSRLGKALEGYKDWQKLLYRTKGPGASPFLTAPTFPVLGWKAFKHFRPEAAAKVGEWAQEGVAAVGQKFFKGPLYKRFAGNEKAIRQMMKITNDNTGDNWTRKEAEDFLDGMQVNSEEAWSKIRQEMEEQKRARESQVKAAYEGIHRDIIEIMGNQKATFYEELGLADPGVIVRPKDKRWRKFVESEEGLGDFAKGKRWLSAIDSTPTDAAADPWIRAEVVAQHSKPNKEGVVEKYMTLDVTSFDEVAKKERTVRAEFRVEGFVPTQSRAEMIEYFTDQVRINTINPGRGRTAKEAEEAIDLIITEHMGGGTIARVNENKDLLKELRKRGDLAEGEIVTKEGKLGRAIYRAEAFHRDLMKGIIDKSDLFRNQMPKDYMKAFLVKYWDGIVQEMMEAGYPVRGAVGKVDPDTGIYVHYAAANLEELVDLKRLSKGLRIPKGADLDLLRKRGKVEGDLFFPFGARERFNKAVEHNLRREGGKPSLVETYLSGRLSEEVIDPLVRGKPIAGEAKTTGRPDVHLRGFGDEPLSTKRRVLNRATGEWELKDSNYIKLWNKWVKSRHHVQRMAYSWLYLPQQFSDQLVEILGKLTGAGDSVSFATSLGNVFGKHRKYSRPQEFLDAIENLGANFGIRNLGEEALSTAGAKKNLRDLTNLRAYAFERMYYHRKLVRAEYAMYRRPTGVDSERAYRAAVESWQGGQKARAVAHAERGRLLPAPGETTAGPGPFPSAAPGAPKGKKPKGKKPKRKRKPRKIVKKSSPGAERAIAEHAKVAADKTASVEKRAEAAWKMAHRDILRPEGLMVRQPLTAAEQAIYNEVRAEMKKAGIKFDDYYKVGDEFIRDVRGDMPTVGSSKIQWVAGEIDDPRRLHDGQHSVITRITKPSLIDTKTGGVHMTTGGEYNKTSPRWGEVEITVFNEAPKKAAKKAAKKAPKKAPKKGKPPKTTQEVMDEALEGAEEITSIEGALKPEKEVTLEEFLASKPKGTALKAALPVERRLTTEEDVAAELARVEGKKEPLSAVGLAEEARKMVERELLGSAGTATSEAEILAADLRSLPTQRKLTPTGADPEIAKKGARPRGEGKYVHAELPEFLKEHKKVEGAAPPKETFTNASKAYERAGKDVLAMTTRDQAILRQFANDPEAWLAGLAENPERYEELSAALKELGIEPGDKLIAKQELIDEYLAAMDAPINEALVADKATALPIKRRLRDLRELEKRKHTTARQKKRRKEQWKQRLQRLQNDAAGKPLQPGVIKGHLDELNRLGISHETIKLFSDAMAAADVSGAPILVPNWWRRENIKAFKLREAKQAGGQADVNIKKMSKVGQEVESLPRNASPEQLTQISKDLHEISRDAHQALNEADKSLRLIDPPLRKAQQALERADKQTHLTNADNYANAKAGAGISAARNVAHEQLKRVRVAESMTYLEARGFIRDYFKSIGDAETAKILEGARYEDFLGNPTVWGKFILPILASRTPKQVKGLASFIDTNFSRKSGKGFWSGAMSKETTVVTYNHIIDQYNRFRAGFPKAKAPPITPDNRVWTHADQFRAAPGQSQRLARREKLLGKNLSQESAKTKTQALFSPLRETGDTTRGLTSREGDAELLFGIIDRLRWDDLLVPRSALKDADISPKEAQRLWSRLRHLVAGDSDALIALEENISLKLGTGGRLHPELFHYTEHLMGHVRVVDPVALPDPKKRHPTAQKAAKIGEAAAPHQVTTRPVAPGESFRQILFDEVKLMDAFLSGELPHIPDEVRAGAGGGKQPFPEGIEDLAQWKRKYNKYVFKYRSEKHGEVGARVIKTLTGHLVRHAWGTLANKEGMAVEEIAERLGHRWVSSSTGYIHQHGSVLHPAIGHTGRQVPDFITQREMAKTVIRWIGTGEDLTDLEKDYVKIKEILSTPPKGRKPSGSVNLAGEIGSVEMPPRLPGEGDLRRMHHEDLAASKRRERVEKTRIAQEERRKGMPDRARQREKDILEQIVRPAYRELKEEGLGMEVMDLGYPEGDPRAWTVAPPTAMMVGTAWKYKQMAQGKGSTKLGNVWHEDTRLASHNYGEGLTEPLTDWDKLQEVVKGDPKYWKQRTPSRRGAENKVIPAVLEQVDYVIDVPDYFKRQIDDILQKGKNEGIEVRFVPGDVVTDAVEEAIKKNNVRVKRSKAMTSPYKQEYETISDVFNNERRDVKNRHLWRDMGDRHTPAELKDLVHNVYPGEAALTHQEVYFRRTIMEPDFSFKALQEDPDGYGKWGHDTPVMDRSSHAVITKVDEAAVFVKGKQRLKGDISITTFPERQQPAREIYRYLEYHPNNPKVEHAGPLPMPPDPIRHLQQFSIFPGVKVPKGFLEAWRKGEPLKDEWVNKIGEWVQGFPHEQAPLPGRRYRARGMEPAPFSKSRSDLLDYMAIMESSKVKDWSFTREQMTILRSILSAFSDDLLDGITLEAYKKAIQTQGKAGKWEYLRRLESGKLVNEVSDRSFDGFYSHARKLVALIVDTDLDQLAISAPHEFAHVFWSSGKMSAHHRARVRVRWGDLSESARKALAGRQIHSPDDWFADGFAQWMWDSRMGRVVDEGDPAYSGAFDFAREILSKARELGYEAPLDIQDIFRKMSPGEGAMHRVPKDGHLDNVFGGVTYELERTLDGFDGIADPKLEQLIYEMGAKNAREVLGIKSRLIKDRFFSPLGHGDVGLDVGIGEGKRSLKKGISTVRHEVTQSRRVDRAGVDITTQDMIKAGMPEKYSSIEAMRIFEIHGDPAKAGKELGGELDQIFERLAENVTGKNALRDMAMFELHLATGVRPRELRYMRMGPGGLKTPEIAGQPGKWEVYVHAVKGGKKRWVPLMQWKGQKRRFPRLREYLLKDRPNRVRDRDAKVAERIVRTGDDPIFLGSKGDQLSESAFQDAYTKLSTEAGFRGRPPSKRRALDTLKTERDRAIQKYTAKVRSGLISTEEGWVATVVGARSGATKSKWKPLRGEAKNWWVEDWKGELIYGSKDAGHGVTYAEAIGFARWYGSDYIEKYTRSSRVVADKYALTMGSQPLARGRKRSLSMSPRGEAIIKEENRIYNEAYHIEAVYDSILSLQEAGKAPTEEVIMGALRQMPLGEGQSRAKVKESLQVLVDDGMIKIDGENVVVQKRFADGVDSVSSGAIDERSRHASQDGERTVFRRNTYVSPPVGQVMYYRPKGQQPDFMTEANIAGIRSFVKEIISGIPPRSDFGKQVAGMNRWIKEAMTTGVFGIPFPAFSGRNTTSAVIQTLMDPSLGWNDAIKGVFAILNDMTITHYMIKPVRYATERGAGGRAFWSRVDAVNDFRNFVAGVPGSGKLIEGMYFGKVSAKKLAGELRDKVVGSDFAARELLRKELDQTPMAWHALRRILRHPDKPLPEKFKQLGRFLKLNFKTNYVPHAIATYTEDTVRINTYVALRSKGFTPGEALRRTQRVHIDYNYVSKFERGLRDFFPFAKFRLGTTPVVLHEAMTRPRTWLPIGKIENRVKDEPDYFAPPWIGERVSIPLGLDGQGNMQFLTGLGIIHEDVSTLLSGPYFSVDGKPKWRALQRGVGAAMHPLIKGPLEMMTGQNFYFGTEQGVYRRAPSWMHEIPGIRHVGYGTGFLTKRTTKDGVEKWEVPNWFHGLASMVPGIRYSSALDKALDDRKGWVSKVFLLNTGLKIGTADQEMEKRRLLASWLRSQLGGGNIGKMEIFFTKGQIPEEDAAMLKEYQRIIQGKGKKKIQEPEEGGGTTEVNPYPSTPYRRPRGRKSSLMPAGAAAGS